MSERIIFAPRGSHTHMLNDETGRTACGKDGDCWPFDGPNDLTCAPTCRVCRRIWADSTQADTAQREE